MASLNSFVSATVSSGYVVALAAICLLQYLIYLVRFSQNKRSSQQFYEEITGLETALTHVQKDRTLTRFENQILREFVTESECDKAMSVLLRRFIPNAEDGFATFVKLADDGVSVLQSRGLSTTSANRLSIDRTLRNSLEAHRTVILEGGCLHNTDLYSKLAGVDRAKVQQLFLLPVNDGREIVAVLLTTDLFPRSADRQPQIELAERLMISIGCSLKHKLTLEAQQTQLYWTNEMLELRAVADRKFDSPLQMIDEFVRQLTKKLGADQSAVFLSNPDSHGPLKLLLQHGELQQPGVRNQSLRSKEIIARATLATRELMNFDAEALEQLGVNNLFGSALVVPLVQTDLLMGAICLTRPHREAFDEEPSKLAAWAADILQGTLDKVRSQAAVVKQARTDGLTQLANRRTFDEQIQLEIASARKSGAYCSLLLFDLDHFKAVNDTYGHRAGDQVLRETARVLQDKILNMRASDRALVARYGGEEMAILLPGISFAGAARIAESIRGGIEAMGITADQQVLRVTTSIGLATFPHHADSVESLVSAADAALYQAKETGRNRVQIAVTNLPPALMV